MDNARNITTGSAMRQDRPEGRTAGRWLSIRTRLERLLIGPGFSALAWVLERALIRSTRRV